MNSLAISNKQLIPKLQILTIHNFSLKNRQQINKETQKIVFKFVKECCKAKLF